MTNFLTITLNPTMDKTVTVEDELTLGGVHRVVAEVSTPGGKGINVSKVLAVNDCAVCAGGILGRRENVCFADFLRSAGIKPDFFLVDQSTRTNLMAVDRFGRELKLNRPGFPGLSLDRAALSEYVLRVAASADLVILSGSLPQDFAADTYAWLIQLLRQAGKSVVLDAAGAALAAGAAAGPDLIKPNRGEVKDLLGRIPATAEMAGVLAQLQHKHQAVIVSDGGRGAYFAVGKDRLFATVPQVKLVDTTGAGDSLLGQFCADAFSASGRFQLTPAIAARAVAAGAAAVEQAGTPLPDRERIADLAAHVQVTRLA